MKKEQISKDELTKWWKQIYHNLTDNPEFTNKYSKSDTIEMIDHSIRNRFIGWEIPLN